MDRTTNELVPDEEAQQHMDNRFEYFGPFRCIKENRSELKDYGELSANNISDWCLFILDMKDSQKDSAIDDLFKSGEDFVFHI